MPPRLILAGAGPAHLEVLQGLVSRPEPARQGTLIADSSFEVCPGMLPGYLDGRYQREDVVLGLERLARAAGLELIEGTIESIDPGRREFQLYGGRSIGYDLASINLGVRSMGTCIPGASRYAHYLHPFKESMSIVPALERVVAEVPEATARVVVAGGGRRGFELALALRRRLDRLTASRGVVTIVDAGHSVWRHRGVTSRLADAAMVRNDITVILGASVAEVGERRLVLSNGARIPFDFLLWNGEPEPPAFLRLSTLPVNERGYLLLDAFLQSTTTPGLFAATDAGMPPADLRIDPEAAGSRDGMVLRDNLLAGLQGRAPSRHVPAPSRHLSLINTADNRAILSYGDLGLEGRWVMLLKNTLDRRFMRRLAALRS
jgi:NADH dehydrogenase FAD-containing subunit